MNISELERLGYTEIATIDGNLCGLMRFMFTVGVCYGLDETGYRGRFCFDNHLDASLFLADWDGSKPPTIGVDGCTAIK
jgi:hypothetical protein